MAAIAGICKVSFFGLVVLSLALAQDISITSPIVTDWGDWGDMQNCPAGNFVYGMRLKTEKDQGLFGDDSALNAIELFCTSPTVRRNVSEFLSRDPIERAIATITSAVGHEGDFGSIFECPDPYFVSGFELRSETDQGWADDDSAANNLKLYCTNGDILNGDGQAWGTWTGQQACPRDTVVCGIQTQVEKPSSSDDSTLNNVRMNCCNK